MYIKKYIYFLFILIGLIACKTSQLSENSVKIAPVANVKIRSYGIGKLIDSISSKYLVFDTLSVKFKIHVDLADESHNLDGVFRIKKDSMLWISLSAPLGIEAARFLLTKDSIYFMNKLKKEYFVRPYSFFENNYHVELTFNDLQALLSDQIFLFSETDEESNLMMNQNSNEKDYVRKTFFRDKDSVNYILKTHRKQRIKRYLKKYPGQELMVENIKITPNTFKIQSVEVVDYVEGRNLNIQYDQFESINNTLFPRLVNFLFADSVKKYQMQLDYSKVKVGNDVTFPFNIPDSYKRIP